MKAWRDISTNNSKEADVCIMGIAFDGAASVGKGAALGPEQIRKCSEVMPPVNSIGDFFEELRIYDAGDVEFTLDWEEYYENVESEAYNLLNTDKFCIFLGGDHSVTIPLGKAFAQKYEGNKIGVIHFDSHPDLCDEYEGSRWSHACPLKRILEDLITPYDLAQVGIRSYEYEEIELYKQNPEITVIKAYDIFQFGYKRATEELIEKFKEYDVVYVTLDIDVLDPAYAPGTGTPEAGGITSRELFYIIGEIIEKLPVKAMDIVEVSPPLDNNNHITSWAAAKIIYEVLGKVERK